MPVFALFRNDFPVRIDVDWQCEGTSGISVPIDLGAFIAAHPDEAQLRIAGNNYQIPSMVNFLQKPDKEAICLSIVYHETMYAFYYPDSTLVGDDLLYIGGGTLFPHEIRPYVDSFTPLDTLVSYRWGQPVSTYGVWRIENYKGKSR